MQVKLLNAKHPEHRAYRLRQLRALAEGGPAWHELRAQWFPQRSMEPGDVYQERLSLALYQNHAGSEIGLIAAMLFSETPTWDGLVGDYWDSLADDADRAGTPWRRWWRELFTSAQIGRRAYVWVNLPARDAALEVGSRADEERLGLLDAYLVPFTADQVIDWEVDERGGLQWLIAHDVVQLRSGPGAPRGRVHRWRAFDAQHITVWEWTGTEGKLDPGPDDEATEVAKIAHGLGQLPVVALELPKELWTMSKLEDAAVAATRARNEHSWALHQAANELLTITSTWGDEEPHLGHGHYLKLTRDATGGADSAEYVAPTGVAFRYLAQDVKDTRDELYRVVQSMALAVGTDDKGGPESGDAKAMDWKALEVVLAAYQDLVVGAMRKVLRLIAKARGEDARELAVKGLAGWASEDLGTFLEAASMATDARQMSSTFRKVIARRQAERLLQDEVSAAELEAIRKEIDEAPDEDPLFGPRVTDLGENQGETPATE